MSKDIESIAVSMAQDIKHFQEHRNEISIEAAQIKLNKILEAINERNKKTKRN